ncbi:MAG: hypothetical protein U0736_11095 [Gemmataceae bacterium]
MSAQCWWLVPFGTLALVVGCQGVAESVRPAGELGGGVAPESWAVTPAWRVSPDDEPPLLQPVRYERRSARAKPHRRAAPAPAPVVRPEAATELPAPVQVRALEVLSRLSHASDYGWLVGRLEQPAGPDRWWIRYAEESEDARYGGALELVGPGTMDGFRAGDWVRVEGELVDPAPLEVRPAYHPRSIQAIP